MQYRRYFVWISVLLLVAILAIPVSAAGTRAELDYVTDSAGLFTESQCDALERKAEQISQKYNFGVYIITMDNFKNYTNSSQISRCAVEVYDKYHLGWDEDLAGTMLMLSMAERDYNLDFNSSRANYVFTETGRDRMEERFLNYFRRNDFYGGFNEYLDTCAEYLEAAQNGTPVGQGGDEEGLGIFAVIPGAIAALLTGVFMSSPMKTARLKTDASDYTVEGSLNLTRRSDMFLHRTVTRTPRQTQSSSGSGSHSYSSGSHSGRSGKF